MKREAAGTPKSDACIMEELGARFCMHVLIE